MCKKKVVTYQDEEGCSGTPQHLDENSFSAGHCPQPLCNDDEDDPQR